MKKVLIAAICMCGALAISVSAQDAPKKGAKRTDEQKALWKTMVTKYDTNNDKKLDKEERAKISAEDQAKLDKAGLGKAAQGKCHGKKGKK